jgi:hypothetical protein
MSCIMDAFHHSKCPLSVSVLHKLIYETLSLGSVTYMLAGFEVTVRHFSEYSFLTLLVT